MLSEEGFLLVRERLQITNSPYYEKHLFLIPSKHKLTELIVKISHAKVFHAQLSSTLIQTREKIRILKCRSCTKSVLNKFTVYKNFNGQQV